MTNNYGGSDNSTLKTVGVVLLVILAVGLLAFQGMRYLGPQREQVIGNMGGPSKAEQAGSSKAGGIIPNAETSTAGREGEPGAGGGKPQ
jgi:hypothetical protein